MRTGDATRARNRIKMRKERLVRMKILELDNQNHREWHSTFGGGYYHDVRTSRSFNVSRLKYPFNVSRLKHTKDKNELQGAD